MVQLDDHPVKHQLPFMAGTLIASRGAILPTNFQNVGFRKVLIVTSYGPSQLYRKFRHDSL